MEKIEYCKRTLESLIEAKEIYNKKLVKELNNNGGELRNLFDDLEVVQEKINDVVTSLYGLMMSISHMNLIIC